MHIENMKSYIKRLGILGVECPKELAIDMVLNLLSSSYHMFVSNGNMKDLDKTVMQLHGMLITINARKTKKKNLQRYYSFHRHWDWLYRQEEKVFS